MCRENRKRWHDRKRLAGTSRCHAPQKSNGHSIPRWESNIAPSLDAPASRTLGESLNNPLFPVQVAPRTNRRLQLTSTRIHESHQTSRAVGVPRHPSLGFKPHTIPHLSFALLCPKQYALSENYRTASSIDCPQLCLNRKQSSSEA
jgi:hypothetical protein